MGLLLSILLFSQSFLQEAVPDTGSGTYHRHSFVLGINYGAIWAHNPPVYHLAQSHPWQITGEYLRQSPEKEWNRSYHSPYFGIGLHYFNYQSAVLGSSLAGIVFLEPELSKRFRYRIGTGMVANFKPFDVKSNITNNMLGGPVAFVMHAQLNYYQPVTEKFQLRIGIGLTHFSNGAFTQPNAGINNFFIGTALCRRGKAVPKLPKSDSISFKRGFSGVFGTSIAFVEKFPVNGPKYPIYHLTAKGQYRIGRKSSVLSGIDYIYNTALAKMLEEEPQFGNQVARMGLTFGHELHISKISMVTELGIYIRKKQNFDPGSYQRYGLRYYWTKYFFTALYLKAHKARAECIEWAIGYKFGRL